MLIKKWSGAARIIIGLAEFFLTAVEGLEYYVKKAMWIAVYNFVVNHTFRMEQIVNGEKYDTFEKVVGRFGSFGLRLCVQWKYCKCPNLSTAQHF